MTEPSAAPPGPPAPPVIAITSTPLGEGPGRLVSLNESYVRAVGAAGGLGLVAPSVGTERVAPLLERIDGILLSGGGDVDPARYAQRAVEQVGGVDPARDEWELALVAGALAQGVPVLAICRGMQVLNVALGGTLVQDLPSVTGQPHRDEEHRAEPRHHVRIDHGSSLAAVLGLESADHRDLASNSLHHQAVDRLGAGLRAVAWADDGTVEAVEAVDGRPVLAVQWHPELLGGHRPHLRLFEWLVDRARRRRSPPPRR